MIGRRVGSGKDARPGLELWSPRAQLCHVSGALSTQPQAPTFSTMFTMVLVDFHHCDGTSLSLSLMCAHSLYSTEGGTGHCVMPCAVMPCPMLASRPHSPLLHWHVDGLRTIGEYMYCMCLNERVISLFIFETLLCVCVRTVMHMGI